MTDPLMALVQKWRRQAVNERPRDDEADASLWTAALDGAADDLRAIMDAFAEPVVTTEYRVMLNGYPTKAQPMPHDEAVSEEAVLNRLHPDLSVTIESRSCRTWITEWSIRD